MKISKDSQAVVYRKRDGNLEFLLLKRYDKDNQKSDYRLIKGGAKKHETTHDAILREVTEESGLHKLEIKKMIGEYSYQAGDVQHNVDVFLVENSEIEEIHIDSSEEGGFTIESAEWLTSNQAIYSLNFAQEKDSVKKSLEIIN